MDRRRAPLRGDRAGTSPGAAPGARPTDQDRRDEPRRGARAGHRAVVQSTHRLRRLKRFLALPLFALGALIAVGPVSTASAFTLHLQPVLTGLRQPLDIRQPADGSDRLFVVEKGGRIRIAHGGQLVDRPFLDLSGTVGARGSEQGLLGLAFHPDYANNGFFYVNYTDANGDSVVARYQVSGDPDVADP